MPVLTPRKPFDSSTPVLRVENKLAAGRHRFALVVIDTQGRASDADELIVSVRELRIPTPVPILQPVPAPRGGRSHGPR